MHCFVSLRPVSALHLRRWLVALLVVSLLICLSSAPVAAQTRKDDGRPLKVMTRNLYQGTDFLEAMGLSSVDDLVGAATKIYTNVRATKPATRVAAVAQEICDNTPDLVALQEATFWQVIGWDGSVVETIDPVALLLSDLDTMGEHYVAVIVQPQFSFTAPSAFGYVSTRTQIAILARAETLDAQMQIVGSKGDVFKTNLPLTVPSPTGPVDLPIARGWAYADIVYRGTAMRFVTLHPEAFYDPIENAQVYELLTGVANPFITGTPVIMAADFNTNAAPNATAATHAGYEIIRQFGFTDVWAATERTDGFTCCQLGTLTNPTSNLDQRIDFVFTSAGLVPFNAKLTGNKTDALVDGMWPSDHAGLVARIRVAN